MEYYHDYTDPRYIDPSSPIYMTRSYDPTPFEGEIFVKLTYPYVAPDTSPVYSISNYGRVYSEFRNTILKPSIDSKGYAIVLLRRANNKYNAYRIHRLLMLIFNPIEGCNKLDIHHKDSNKCNFRPENLEWCTKSYNMKEAYRMGEIYNKQGEERTGATISNDIARQICECIERGEIMTEIAEKFNVNPQIVYNISNERAWRSISKDYDFSNKNKTCKRKKDK